MLISLCILLAFLFAGDFIASVGFPLPGNVTGMLLLLAALFSGLVKEEWIEGASGTLLVHLALFFVPAGVGVMVHAGVLADYWLPISGAVLFSTLAVLVSVGMLHRFFVRIIERGKDE